MCPIPPFGLKCFPGILLFRNLFFNSLYLNFLSSSKNANIEFPSTGYYRICINNATIRFQFILFIVFVEACFFHFSLFCMYLQFRKYFHWVSYGYLVYAFGYASLFDSPTPSKKIVWDFEVFHCPISTSADLLITKYSKLLYNSPIFHKIKLCPNWDVIGDPSGRFHIGVTFIE